jgi:endoglucanase
VDTPATDAANTAPAGSPVALHGALHVTGTHVYDQNGAIMQLRGASGQWLNWETQAFCESKPLLQYLRDTWYVNVIRAPMGIEVAGGYLNGGKAAMLAKVNKIVQNAIDLGVYVIIDWHTEKAVTQQTDAVAFFQSMATQWGSYPNVIYEDYNEPNGTGTTWPLIKPYHEAVVAAIRAIDPSNLITLGTPTWSQDVDIASASPVAGTNLTYTLHWYSGTHKQPLRDKGNVAIANGVALFVSEFGATTSDGITYSQASCTEAGLWWAWMNTNGISGVSWKLDQCTDGSCLLAAGSTPTSGNWQLAGHGPCVQAGWWNQTSF